MNTVIQVVFFIISAIILGGALLTVTARNLVHAALWLIAAFFGIGALYMLMQAEFAAITQVLIYVGAIAVLILFAIMLTPDLAGERDIPIFQHRWIALVVAAALFGVLIVPTVWNYVWSVPKPLEGDIVQVAGARKIGAAFMSGYLLPFELASVLLLAALIGAIVIGIDDNTRQRILTLAEEFRLRNKRQASEKNET